MGGLAWVKKYGHITMIPIEAKRRGGRNSAKSQNRKQVHYAERLFDSWAVKNGFTVYKNGFPDRVVERNGEISFVEVKCPKGRLERSQQRLFTLLAKIGYPVTIWRPSTRSLWKANREATIHSFDAKPEIVCRLSSRWRC